MIKVKCKCGQSEKTFQKLREDDIKFFEGECCASNIKEEKPSEFHKETMKAVEEAKGILEEKQKRNKKTSRKTKKSRKPSKK